MVALHGRVDVRDPVTNEPPTPSAAVRDPTRGEAEARSTASRFRRGGKRGAAPRARGATCRPGCSTAARATIERIFVDYDGKVHLA